MNNRLTALIALFIAGGLYFGYVSPTWNGSIAETKDVIESTQNAINAADAYKEKEAKLVAKRDSIDQSDIDRLEKLVPNSVENVGLTLALTALAGRKGLIISSIDVTSNSSDTDRSSSSFNVNPVSSIDMSISATGSYRALQSFLEGVEKSQRLLDVRTLTVGGSDSGIYTYQMTIRIYWLRS